MVLNLGAYSTEIIRAGTEATPKGQIEAAQTLAMGRGQTFRHVVLPQSAEPDPGARPDHGRASHRPHH